MATSASTTGVFLEQFWPYFLPYKSKIPGEAQGRRLRFALLSGRGSLLDFYI
jgi:hypothetical protein